jgi:hypothetical protein
VADVIAGALRPELSDDDVARLRRRVTALADAFPLYAGLSPFAA